MKPQSETDPTCTDHSRATGRCGGPGLCPGIALFLAYVIGVGIAMLTGLPWLGWAAGVPVALILLTGAWRWLPGRRVNRVEAASVPDET